MANYMSRISLRRAVPDDATALVEIHHSAVHAIDAAHYSSETLSAWSPAPSHHRSAWLSSLIDQGSTLCIVAIADNARPVGFCLVLTDQAKLQALYVDPSFSGVGVGRALLHHAESECRSLGIRELWLAASYNAEAFYRRVGYEPVGPTTQPLSEAVAMGATKMVKALLGGD